jgi:hypothetical protein
VPMLIATRCPATIADTPPAQTAPDRSARLCARAPGARPQTHRAPVSCQSFNASQHAPHCRGRSGRSRASLRRTIEASTTTPSQRSWGNGASVRGPCVASSNTPMLFKVANNQAQGRTAASPVPRTVR